MYLQYQICMYLGILPRFSHLCDLKVILGASIEILHTLNPIILKNLCFYTSYYNFTCSISKLFCRVIHVV
jgi:hypothetical protein